MSHFVEQDGKSPTEAKIAERAYHLWLERGCREGSEEQNWLEAERELHDAVLSRRLIEIADQKGGSVQS
jgi:DUF2934 family protein